ncbi:putative membrane protein [Mesoflavibacter sabulilitoris]|uniref:Uncharacterized protein n=1 Tax=Mesoflavibacter zeaxanthinifaciens subsp. sabulilitoris TaxID=1520893 RepID=A0A2T1NNQ6_9FLAO|nr:hypothetical protein [Mesoflavibacter zeaxanthinifaciens]MBB3125286.1 putative membrane protein [Mesoflavibacter zeaxanthinifaciens subsp. sabulilitoris]PSG94521.1 hypothetical protein C7H61_00880 [Mesoflavibacter zeaxanthinifaciens subsp. sabulilitoris]
MDKNKYWMKLFKLFTNVFALVFIVGFVFWVLYINISPNSTGKVDDFFLIIMILISIVITLIIGFKKYMKNNKLPRWFRIIRYYFNCLWYHVLFPIGIEEDNFTKQFKNEE